MTDQLPEEVFIVGYRYRDNADDVSKLFKLNRPIEKKDIIEVFGDDSAFLKPVESDIDPYCVAVYDIETKHIGYVWMLQAPTMRRWMETHNEEYISIRITGTIPLANVLIGVMEEPLDVPMTYREFNDFDPSWASNLPGILRGDSENKLDLQLTVLRKELSKAKGWNKILEKNIGHLFESIPLDLSSYRHNIYMELFVKMRMSKIKEVRDKSVEMLKTLLYRGSKEYMEWWTEEWLPDYFRKVSEGHLFKLFEAAHYTLESVEDMLEEAPANLYYLYKADKIAFVRRLYYYALPKDAYNRLLTLLAVREMMLEKAEDAEVIDPSAPLSKEVLAQAIEDVQDYFWGYSSNAVLFCVCKDKYNYLDNTSQFERETRELKYHKKMAYLCADGTISNAFKNNSYMKYNIDKWEEKGAKERALILRDEFIKAVERAKKNMAGLRKTA